MGEMVTMYLRKIAGSLLTLATVTTYSVPVLAQSANQIKAIQCERILRINNETVTNIKSITNNGQITDTSSTLSAAAAMETGAKKLEIAVVTNPRLHNYRKRFITMYRQISQATRTYVAAEQKRERKAMEAAMANLSRAVADEFPLVQEINTYCDVVPSREK